MFVVLVLNRDPENSLKYDVFIYKKISGDHIVVKVKPITPLIWNFIQLLICWW